jgi:hypothetical protein
MLDINICILGYVHWQFFMSLMVMVFVHYLLLFLDAVLYGVTMFGPSSLLTLF